MKKTKNASEIVALISSQNRHTNNSVLGFKKNLDYSRLFSNFIIKIYGINKNERSETLVRQWFRENQYSKIFFYFFS